MNWYLILKFIHVAGVISWLGGAGALVFAATISHTFEQRKSAIAIVTFLSPRLFIPALGVVLLSGGTLWWVGALTFDAWVAYGLTGILITGTLGVALLGPEAERISKLIEANAPQQEIATRTTKLLRMAQADMVVLASIVVVMVTKPSWSDTGSLFALIAVVIAAAAFFLTRPAKVA